jgi:mRNA interferase RelE/StbE
MIPNIVLNDNMLDQFIGRRDVLRLETIRYTRAAARALRRHRNMASRVIGKIEQYAKNPDSLTNTIITMSTGYRRLRVGDFRVIFRENAVEIEILDIGPRGGIYN